MLLREEILVEANHATLLATDQAVAAMIVGFREQTAETNDARSTTAIPEVVAVGTAMDPLHNIMLHQYH